MLLAVINGLALHKARAQTNLIPPDTNVRIGRLPNGFSFYIRKNGTPGKRVTLCLVNKVGSIVESDKELGLAHFLEHMGFDGTKHYPGHALIEHLQGAGVRFGADLNASTAFDETIYQFPLASDDPATLISGLDILHDWAQDMTLSRSAIDKERSVVLEEMREGKDANQRMLQKYLPVLLNHSLYADRIPLGKEEIINTFRPRTLRRFYKEWYRPGLQGIIVVGDIDADRVEEIIKAKFSDLRNPKNSEPRIAYTIPLEGEDHYLTVTDKEYPATVIQILIKHPGLVIRTTSDLRENIIRSLYNILMKDRFSGMDQRPDAPFSSGSSMINNFMAGLDALFASATCKPDEIRQGCKALWAEILRVKKFGFSSFETDRAKQEWSTQLESRYMGRAGISSAGYISECQKNFLTGEAIPGIAYEYDFCKKTIGSISTQEINSYIGNYIGDMNRDVMVLCPDNGKDKVPDEAMLATWIRETESSDIAVYTENVPARPLLSALPPSGKIISEKEIPGIGVTELILSNGVKVILKPTAFKNNEILFSSFCPGGTSLYGDKDLQSASNASLIVKNSGAGDFNAVELAGYLNGRAISVTPYILESAEGVNGYSSEKDVETALQLVYLYFTQPRMDPAVYAGIISRTRANLVNRGNDPNSVFSDTVTAVLGSYNIRRTGPSMEKVDQIDRERAFEIYKDRFSNAGGFTFTFVGSFDTAQMKLLVRRYLGSLPFNERREAAGDPGISTPRGRVTRLVNKGKEAKSETLLIFSGDYEYSVEENNQLIALADVLKMRLTERLRRDAGGVYGVELYASYVKYPKGAYSLSISFGCSPENVDKLIGLSLEEVEKMKKYGVLAADVGQFRAEKTLLTETQLGQNSFWLNYLTNKYQNKEDPARVFAYKEKLAAITQQSLKERAVKYLNRENFIRFVLMPEMKNNNL